MIKNRDGTLRITRKKRKFDFLANVLRTVFRDYKSNSRSKIVKLKNKFMKIYEKVVENEQEKKYEDHDLHCENGKEMVFFYSTKEKMTREKAMDDGRVHDYRKET